MTFRPLIPVAMTLALGLATRPVQAQQPTATADTTAAIAAATAAALAWLDLIDAGDVAASWDSAATGFKQAVTKANWEAAVRQARGPFEPFGERTLTSSQYTTSLPNAPAGEYVILQFRTAVAGDRHVTETVAPNREPDGTWKVSGYFVRPG